MNCRGKVGIQYNYKGLDVMLQMSGNKQFQREGEKRADVRNSCFNRLTDHMDARD